MRNSKINIWGRKKEKGDLIEANCRSFIGYDDISNSLNKVPHAGEFACFQILRLFW